MNALEQRIRAVLAALLDLVAEAIASKGLSGAHRQTSRDGREECIGRQWVGGL